MKEQKKNETLMKLYNTDIVGNFRNELVELGYISIASLMLTREDRENLINEARKGHNNLALSPTSPLVICVNKSFYQKYLINNSKEESEINVKIKSRNSLFINKLMNYLENESTAEFEISFSTIERPNISRKEKINFLRTDTLNAAFDVRTTNCLRSADLKSVFEIYDYRSRLFMIRQFGENSMKNIVNKFAENGLDFENIPKNLIEEAKHPPRTNE